MFPHEALPDHIGPYKILRHLSSRGSADLYLGEHIGPMGFQRTCVLKLVPAPGPDDVRSAQELAHEAKICSRLNHPAIVRMHDFFEHGDRLVLVFEHFAGLSLARLLAHLRRRRMELSDTITWYIAHQLFSALAHAHALADEEGRPTPVVHRDVQPAHIIISNDAQVRLTGYGIAKIAGTVGDTAVGFVKGTPAYMAPEQARGEKVTERVDVYAAGLVMWEMLTGQSAVPAGQNRPGGELLRLISGRRVEPVMSMRTDIPREIGAAIDACLEPAADKRSIKCADVERWLKKVCDVNSGREQLRERLVQMRNVSVRPPAAAGSQRGASIPPKPSESMRVPPRFPGVATRVTGRVSAAAPGQSQAPPMSRRPPAVRGNRPSGAPPSARPPAPEHASEVPTRVKPRRGTLVGLGPAAAEAAAALRAPRAPEAVPEEPAASSAQPTNRLPHVRQGAPARQPTLLGIAPSPTAAQAPARLPPARTPEPAPAAPASPKVVVAAEPAPQDNVLSTADLLGSDGQPASPAARTASAAGEITVTQRRPASAGRWILVASMSVVGVLAVGGLVFGLSRMFSGSKPAASASAAQPVAVAPSSAPAPVVTSPPAPTATASVATSESATPPASARPSSSSPLDSVELSSIPRGFGAVLAKSPPEGVVYVNGHPRGDTDKPFNAPCGRMFVRVGTKMGPKGLKAVSWLAPGQSVVIPCQNKLEIDATPEIPIKDSQKKAPKDPKLPWSIAPF